MLTFKACLFVWFVSVQVVKSIGKHTEKTTTHILKYVFNGKHAM